MRRVLALLFVFAMAPCGAQDVPGHWAVPEAAKAGIESTDVIVAIGQKQIYLAPPPAGESASYTCARDPARENSLLVGLAKMTGDPSVVRLCTPESAIAPALASLGSFDVDAVLRDEIGKAMARVAWLHATTPSILKDTSDNAADLRLSTSKASAVLFTAVTYFFSADGKFLYVNLSVALLPNTDTLRALRPYGPVALPKSALGNALYRNVFTFQTRPKGWLGTNREGYLLRWSEDGQLRAALVEGAAKLSEMLAADLDNQITAGRKSFSLLNRVDGTIAKRDKGGIWVRIEPGMVHYVAEIAEDDWPQ